MSIGCSFNRRCTFAFPSTVTGLSFRPRSFDWLLVFVKPFPCSLGLVDPIFSSLPSVTGNCILYETPVLLFRVLCHLCALNELLLWWCWYCSTFINVGLYRFASSSDPELQPEMVAIFHRWNSRNASHESLLCWGWLFHFEVFHHSSKTSLFCCSISLSFSS